MPSIQVKDVPEEVHAVLRRRAAAAGQSLQEYLLARLTKEAATPTLEEAFEQIGGHENTRAGLRREFIVPLLGGCLRFSP